MKQIKKFIIVFFLFSFETKIHSDQNNILIKIDNKIITSQDIKNKIITNLLLSKKEINQSNIDNLKRKTIEDLIIISIKKIELEKFNFKRDDLQINTYLNSITGNNIISIKNLFKSNNVSFEVFLEEIDTELKWRKLIYRKFQNKIEINPVEIDREIENISKGQKKIYEYNLSEIEILDNERNSESEEINQIYSEIKDFGFENAVLKFSISPSSSKNGNLGWINSQSLSNEILSVLNKMKVGEISLPIKKQNKIIFLKLNDKRSSSLSELNIEELKEKIINQKKNDMFKLYSSSYLSQLRNSKYIEYFK